MARVSDDEPLGQDADGHIRLSGTNHPNSGSEALLMASQAMGARKAQEWLENGSNL
jgi:hypothetical protein